MSPEVAGVGGVELLPDPALGVPPEVAPVFEDGDTVTVAGDEHVIGMALVSMNDTREAW